MKETLGVFSIDIVTFDKVALEAGFIEADKGVE